MSREREPHLQREPTSFTAERRAESTAAATAPPMPVASPSVSHIIEALVERIESGTYLGGRTIPTERALAAEFGVSRVTIRQAVADLERRALIARAARCRPVVRHRADAETSRDAMDSTNGGGVSTARRNVAVWLWPRPDAPGTAMILRGIRQALAADDFRIILECPLAEDRLHPVEPERQFLRRIVADADVSGVILWYLGGEDNLPALQAVRAAGLPLVFLDREPPEEFDSDYVGVDNAESAAMLVRYLIRLGHRNIVHITNRERVSTVAARWQGYRHALESEGIPYRPELVLRYEGEAPGDPDWGERRLADAIAALRDREEFAPTAAFVVNDYTALRLVTALRDGGIRVPEDFAVAGFDGIERWMPGPPFLTTICQPYERIGRRAAEVLRSRLQGDAARPCRHIVLEGTLFPSDSTAATVTPTNCAKANGVCPAV